MKSFGIAVLAGVMLLAGATAFGHPGRRLEIQVIDNQLWAQGYITPGQPDDGAGLVRPYYNAIHGHWDNLIPSLALADLPSFDIFTPDGLAGYDVTLELLGASKWVSPPMMPAPGTIPNLMSLDVGETITVEFGGNDVNTDALGVLTLASSVSVAGAEDLDLQYTIGANPTGVLYALRWKLSTTAPGIADSMDVYTILSPEGELHHASLYLESYLGTPVPEPSSFALLAIGVAATGIYGWRRRVRRAGS